MGRYSLGLDIGTSSVKVTLLDVATGRAVATAFSPASDIPISAPQPGFAEQHPDLWWEELVNAMNLLRRQVAWAREDVSAIGIAYQMHGLVCVGRDLRPLRPAIIWCDSRAVPYGDAAFRSLGPDFCLSHYLNSPGNFTLAKLKWVKENQPEVFEAIYKVMLPGDYIAMRLTGEVQTTVAGLSEGIAWDFSEKRMADELLAELGIPGSMIAPIVPTFGMQGRVTAAAAELLGVSSGIPVSYRAGDQPNNAFSLNVLEPGEVAATAGTSGVVYGVTDQADHDPLSRVNSFAHVNHSDAHPRIGILLCINGTGILNSWIRRQFMPGMSYAEMNARASTVPPLSEGLRFYPFGNGAERVLENRQTGAAMEGLDLNRHGAGHVIRAAQEGIVFALQYGMEVMKGMGLDVSCIRAGDANMFRSEIFSQAFAHTAGCRLELYNTDGATGAARAAGLGAGIFASPSECFRGMELIRSYEPDPGLRDTYLEGYTRWREGLGKYL
jgi:xylulokinase